MIGKTAEGTWRVRVKSRGEVIASKTFKRRGDALTWEAEQKRLLQSGDWIDPKLGQERMVDVTARWLDMRSTSVAGKTYQTDESLLRNHVPIDFSKRPIGTIRPSDIESLYIGMINRGRSIKSVSRFRGSLSSFFGWVVRERIIRTNPVETAHLPKGTGEDSVEEIYPFTLEELRSVVADLSKTGDRWGDLALVLGFTGIRWGELMALRCRDLQEVPYPAIQVKRSAPDGQAVRNTTKGGAPRTVPLVEDLLPIFRVWMAGRSPDDLIFSNSVGNRTGRSNWTRAVQWSAHARGRRIHDLRHTAATLWLNNGVDPKTVQTWLGHSSMTLTVDTYSHYMGNDADAAAIARMNRVFSEISLAIPGAIGIGTGTEMRSPEGR